MKQVTGALGNLAAELLDPVPRMGYPKEADLSALEDLAETIATRPRHLA